MQFNPQIAQQNFAEGQQALQAQGQAVAAAPPPAPAPAPTMEQLARLGLTPATEGAQAYFAGRGAPPTGDLNAWAEISHITQQLSRVAAPVGAAAAPAAEPNVVAQVLQGAFGPR